jgi:hypothetical protein
MTFRYMEISLLDLDYIHTQGGRRVGFGQRYGTHLVCVRLHLHMEALVSALESAST